MLWILKPIKAILQKGDVMHFGAAQSAVCELRGATMDPYQFAYRSNRSTDDAIALTVHSALTHLDRNIYVRMLFIDYSSAFNTIIPAKLIPKLTDLGLNSLCNWVLDFLTGRPQVVRVGNSFSFTLTLSTGAPQGSVLSPLLYSLFTHDCVARHTSNTIFKFADDTTILGLITDRDEWCYHNNLSLNISKTKEMIVDYRKLQRGGHSPLYINGAEVERVSSVRFLGVHLTDDLSWSLHTNKVVRSAHQRLFFLRRLRKFGLPPDIPTNFYSCTIESVLTACITVWYGSCTAYESARTNQINLRLILVSGKTKEFLFSPSNSAADIAKHVYDNWPMALTDLSEKVASNESRLTEAENRISAGENSSVAHSNQLNLHDKRLAQLQAKIDDLENRGRRKNIKIVGLPERAEGSVPLAKFVSEMLPKWLDLPPEFSPEIERAHRSLAMSPPERGPPRRVLIRFIRYPDKETVLWAALQKRQYSANLEGCQKVFKDT
ncbi:hypothetical protein NFI96_005326 [Prochilodus magdalenae]|nr:hypothetical protein NFI96_005326 [Prochilodus magdalenae]